MHLGSRLSFVFLLSIGALTPSPWASAQTSRPDERARVAPTGNVDLRRQLELEGVVLGPDGNPVEGAVVVSSAGGKAVTDASGNYRITVEVPSEASSVQVTAVGGTGGSLVASQQVALSAVSRSVWAGALVLARGSPCPPNWLPTFGPQPGTNAAVRTLTVFDDGSGPALYAGGEFSSAGGVAAWIAKWDGSSWTALAGGDVDFAVHALTVFDDGGGAALYAGGDFTSAGGVSANRIAKWNGSSWAALGSGLDMNGTVWALTVFDDGGGPALYVGGFFNSVGGVPANHIARWDGSSWAALGSGMNSTVLALTVFDDGGGPVLYAGGSFLIAGGAAANRIAKWDGSSWTAPGSGVNAAVSALTVFDDGGGAELYAGGEFTNAGGVGANRIAKWDGSSWAALGTGMSADVRALTVFDDGGGAALYAGGGSNVDGVVARWNGVSWSQIGSAMNSSVYALTVFDDGGGAALHAGGEFTSTGGVFANRIAEWSGSSWMALTTGSVNCEVRTLTVFDDGGGAALYVGGDFTSAGGAAADRVAKWDGSSWTTLGSGMNGTVHTLTVYDDGGGAALYAGGDFTSAGGVAANRVAQWDGSSWTALGSGVNSRVRALIVFDDGGGAALYAGGGFTSAGGVAANRIAKWNGANWTALGSGLQVGTGPNALAVYDDGGGPALYAAGNFGIAGGVAASRIAKWNGSSWTALAGGGMDAFVSALAVYDDGGGSALYAGGGFSSAGGVAVRQVAKWDGSGWTALAGGVTSVDADVSTLAVFDDGGGAALYAGGFFTSMDGVAANRIAKWDGSSWTALGSGLNDRVRDLTVFDDGNGAALYAGGSFGSAIDSGDSYLARWGCPDSTAPTLFCPSSVTVRDPFGGPPGESVSFTVTATDNLDPSPDIVCTPPSGSFFPRGTTIVHCTATDDRGNQSSCQFPVHVGLKASTR